MSRCWTYFCCFETGVDHFCELFICDFPVIIHTDVFDHLIYVSVARWLNTIKAENVFDMHGCDVVF